MQAEILFYLKLKYYSVEKVGGYLYPLNAAVEE